ncbi:MFS transporter [Streptomyces sp. MZ04]|uniref:MFS transporter n=1 Tax=Streptomyces sp. MZ04 TaxID=2559236 RepID=UPI00107EA20C|nr:MFS transporter [Streptomyces sp. MZ04]TGB15851.1 MFS transporter [Streptomyces sp. MZ04]
MPASRAARGWLPAAAAVFAAGWGANQFTPLAVVYRTQEHWPPLPVAAMFTVYLLGLLPGLLLGGAAADRFGRRRVVRPALALSGAASALLAAAPVSQTSVYVSRLATGVAAGVILTAGTKWLRELSAGCGRRAAVDRRATLATGGGFATGALTAGAVAEWLPRPMVLPGLVHCSLALLVLGATCLVPETESESASESTSESASESTSVADAAHTAPLKPRVEGPRRAAVRHPRFLWVVLPATPAVFGAATVAYVVLPPLVADQVPGYAPLFSGLVAALTLATGIVVQPLAMWLDHAHSARATLAAMVTVIGGLMVGAFAVRWDSAGLVLAAAVLLGAGYGLTLASGLMEMERLTPPKARPSTAFLYQGATYSGFLTPLLLALASSAGAGAAPYHHLLAAMAAVGLLCLLITARHSRRSTPPRRGETSWDA